MKSVNLRLFSTSTVYGSGYLDYCADEVVSFFGERKEILFVPFARPGGVSHDEYTGIAAKRFEAMGLRITGVHSVKNPVKAVKEAEGIFIGGGNTFLLLKTLYEKGLLEKIKEAVLGGTPYMGSSAGSNVAGLTISTTNDMPVVYPPSFEAMGLIPLNINPHYLDPVPDSRHMGETRETRIREFHHFNVQPVVGLREGSWLSFGEGVLQLGGNADARIFRRDAQPEELPAGSNLNFLLS